MLRLTDNGKVGNSPFINLSLITSIIPLTGLIKLIVNKITANQSFEVRQLSSMDDEIIISVMM